MGTHAIDCGFAGRRCSGPGRVTPILVTLVVTLACLGCNPDLHSRNWMRRAKAAGRVKSQARLARIAVYDEAEPVCLTAVAGLTDPELLGVVAFGSPNSRVQIAAVEQLTDPTLLVSLAEQGRHIHTRIAAIGKLTDPAVLAAIARRNPDPAIRQAAASRLTDLQESPDPDRM